jgi:hypothetical protein
LALVRGSRPENTTVDRHIALNDAHQLNKVCIGKVGKEDTLIHIFCTRSPQQLTATLNYYHQHYGQEFEQVAIPPWCCFYLVEIAWRLSYHGRLFNHNISVLNLSRLCLQFLLRENSGDFEQALRFTVMCFRQPAKFYAEVHSHSN